MNNLVRSRESSFLTKEDKAEVQEMIPRKPQALNSNSVLARLAVASPAEETRIAAGVQEIRRLGFQILDSAPIASEGYFAGTVKARTEHFLSGLQSEKVDGLIATRGGYGSNYLLSDLQIEKPDYPQVPKVIIGFSDLTSLQIFLWQRYRWTTIYGPMLAAGFDAGAGASCGYDESSFLASITNTSGGWKVPLLGESLSSGIAEGRILGGCMTLVQTTIGTPWELDTRDAVFILEDRAMKPWQIDRALIHLKQAGKFDGVRGIVLGDFPECEPPGAGSATVRQVCERILAPLGIPIVYGSPIGHTKRPMLTLPLGVQARLIAENGGTLEILEPAVVP